MMMINNQSNKRSFSNYNNNNNRIYSRIIHELSLLLLLLLCLLLASEVEANTAPIAVDDNDIIIEFNTPHNIDVLTNDSDGENDPLTVSIVSTPTHGSVFIEVDQTITYSPDSNYVGSDSFTYKANDGALDSNTVTVSITVNSFTSSSYSIALTGPPDKVFTSSTIASLTFTYNVGNIHHCTVGTTPETYCDFQSSIQLMVAGSPPTCGSDYGGTALSVDTIEYTDTNVLAPVNIDFETAVSETDIYDSNTLSFCLAIKSFISGSLVNVDKSVYSTSVNIDGAFNNDNAESGGEPAVTITLIDKAITDETGQTDFDAPIYVDDCGTAILPFVMGTPVTLCVKTNAEGFTIDSIDSVFIEKTGNTNPSAIHTLVTSGTIVNAAVTYIDCSYTGGYCSVTFLVDSNIINEGSPITSNTDLTFSGVAILGGLRRRSRNIRVVNKNSRQLSLVEGTFNFQFNIESNNEQNKEESIINQSSSTTTTIRAITSIITTTAILFGSLFILV